MKVIFLDVDGVLNCVDWFKKNKGKTYEEINPEKVSLLKEIVDKTNAKVVLSSTWRNMRGGNGEPDHPMYTYLKNTLKEYGIEIFSHTPLINNDRPKEIAEWIKNMQCDIEFISIDDDFSEKDYRKYGIYNRLVKTCFWEEDGGLRKEHVEKAINLLNK